jgi:hypothetical protein
MNQELWHKILEYDLDDLTSVYGFSTRLANENSWTLAFTTQAILEYKKFMYLASNSDLMVSPSMTVDIVWHQHLIFTQSYSDFCKLLGKQIQHIPSTHKTEEFENFEKAKERTIKLYESNFGNRPKNIWKDQDMFESLNLEKAKFELRTFITFGIIAFVCLLVPAYFLLRPVYLQIDNPYFIYGFISLSIVTFFLLNFYNKSKLKTIVSGFDDSSFVFCLHPFELVYLKTQKLSDVINGAVNELIDNQTIKVNENYIIELTGSNASVNISQLQVKMTLKDLGITYYPNLLQKLATKPIFLNISKSMDAFGKHFIKSKKFGVLFYKNFILLTLLILLSFTRIVTGIFSDKPVSQIIIVTIILIIIAIVFLHLLTEQISNTIIPDLYKNEILLKKQIEINWQWKYFLSGTAVLATSFVPLVNYIDKNNTSNGGSCGSSCGSSCGGGGCGGD